jgi:hypothetical protein
VSKQKPAILFVFLIGIIALGAAAAAKFNLISPKDTTKTQATRIGVSVSAPDAKKVVINGAAADREKTGEFSAMATLKPGKNIIYVKAAYPDGRTYEKKARILRIVISEDLGMLSKGKQYWAKQQITTLLTLGIIEAYPDNTFQPEKFTSRGEFATWLARAKELKTFKPKKDLFYDVPKEHWRAPYIRSIIDKGYMKGLKNNRFGINEKVTRADAVAAVAKANGLANGKIKKFSPERGITRAEAAVLLSKLSNVSRLNASLNNFQVGYTSDRQSKISTKPVVTECSANPVKVMADGKTTVKISAKVSDAQGDPDISFVWANLSPLGGPNNAKMNFINNGKYEVSFTVPPETPLGAKEISVRALDRSGLKSPISNVKIRIIKGAK